MNETNKTIAQQIYLVTFLSKNKEAHPSVQEALSPHAQLLKIEDLGERDLCYPINKQHKLFLHSIYFSAAPESIAFIRQFLRESKEIERFLITKYNASLEEKKKKPATKQKKNKEENV